MDDKTLTSGTTETNLSIEKSSMTAAERAGVEHREAYGTAKTENLRDSGLWRFFLPVVVILFCLALLAIPLIILFPLFYQSIDPTTPTGIGSHGAHLMWLWITMIVLEVFMAAIIIQGLVRIFMTQAGNYTR